jgi:hypothetical protein
VGDVEQTSLKSPSPGLSYSFDPERHIYRHLASGRILPGCTRVLDSTGMVDFAAVRSEILERKKKLGTAVHAATQYFDEDKLDWSSVSEEVRGYLDGWIDFRAKTGFRPRLREHQEIGTINTMNFGMKLDAEGILFRHESIVDITLAQVIPWWKSVQVAGYMAGLAHKDFPSTNSLARFLRRTGYIVRLSPDGKWKLSDPIHDRRLYDTFAAALYVTHVKLEHGFVPERIIEDV